MADSSATIHHTDHNPAIFDEFFELGLDETVSPFLKPESRQWGANLTLKASICAAFFLLTSFIFSFYPYLLPLSHFLLVLVYFLAGIPSLIESIEDLLSLDINIDILMTLAAFSSVLIGSGMEGGLLLVLFALSGAMEDAVETKAKGSISSLNKLSPTKACVIEDDGTLLERSLADIPVGTKILIKSGQIVPLDGIVLEGTSSVNLVHLTGESLPIRKQPKDEVPAGARNLEGALTIKVTHTSADSTLSRIIQLVTQAQEARPVLQRWFDKLSRAYALTIIGLSAIFALTFPIFLNIPYFGIEGSVYRSLAFLIAASPCALIIAIPIAYLSAISACARRGILLKGGITLDAIASCTAIAFDKTGTLTTGQLLCEGIEALENVPAERLAFASSVAYSMERNAVHPIAKAIVTYAQANKNNVVELKDYRSIPGYGLEAQVEYNHEYLPVYIGHPDYIIPKLTPETGKKLKLKAKEIHENGELLAVMLLSSELYIFRFHDTLRPKIRETLEKLKTKRNWQLVMLTGDHENTAKHIAEQAGIEEYHANLKPEDKLKYVSELSQQRGLAMIGDGVNDAPALARATVGICMGKFGSTAAIDAADVVLLGDNIELLDWLVGKSNQTKAIVRQNLFIAAGAILIATIPALSGLIPLWLAVIMHEGGTVLVGLNGLRLIR